MKKFIKDKRGQWAHPGKNTFIPNANGRITMKGVGYPLLGIDDEGNSTIMQPGGEYQFPGDGVYEIPLTEDEAMAYAANGYIVEELKEGGNVSWDFKGKSYSGTLIPSMEDENNRYARTHKGNIKTLPKAQDAGQVNGIKSLMEFQKNLKNPKTIESGRELVYGEPGFEEQQESRRKDRATIITDLVPNIPTSIQEVEKLVDDSLGNPQQKARDLTEKYAKEGDDPSDPARHIMAAKLTADAIKNKTGNIPYLSQGLGWLGSNALGVGHELGTIFNDDRDFTVKFREAAEDIRNNLTGSNLSFDRRSNEFVTRDVINNANDGLYPDGYGEKHPFKDNQDWTDPYDLKKEVDGGYILEELPTAQIGTTGKSWFKKLYEKNIELKKQQLENKKNNILNQLYLRQAFAESSFNPNAVSPVGAQGLTQFMPNTIADLKTNNLVSDSFNPLDPKQAVDAQRKYMQWLSERPYLNKGKFSVKQAKFLGAYNYGAGYIKDALTKAKKDGVDIYETLDWVNEKYLPKETADYINKIYGKNDKFNKEFREAVKNKSNKSILDLYEDGGSKESSDNAVYSTILDGIGAPVTDENLKFLKAWRQAEGGTAANNPFNTTYKLGVDQDKTDYNSVGVKNYSKPEYGIAATIKTLQLPYYKNIVNGLQNDVGASNIASNTDELKTWGTGAGVARVLNKGKVNPPSIKGDDGKSIYNPDPIPSDQVALVPEVVEPAEEKRSFRDLLDLVEEDDVAVEEKQEVTPTPTGIQAVEDPFPIYSQAMAAMGTPLYTDVQQRMLASEQYMKDGGFTLDLDENDVAKYVANGYIVEELPQAQKGIAGLMKFQKTIKNPTTTTAVKKEPVANSQAAQFAKNYNKDIRKVNQAHKDAGTKPLELTPEIAAEINKKEFNKSALGLTKELFVDPAIRTAKKAWNDPAGLVSDIATTTGDIFSLPYTYTKEILDSGVYDMVMGDSEKGLDKMVKSEGFNYANLFNPEAAATSLDALSIIPVGKALGKTKPFLNKIDNALMNAPRAQMTLNSGVNPNMIVNAYQDARNAVKGIKFPYSRKAERLDQLKGSGAFWDDAGISAENLLYDDKAINYLGTKSGRPIVQITMPDKSKQMFYKSSGWAGKSGDGVGGTTEGMWQPFGGFASKSKNTPENWFIKDVGYKDFYGSKTYKGIANELDNTLMKKLGAKNIDELDEFINFQNRNRPLDDFTPDYNKGGLVLELDEDQALEYAKNGYIVEMQPGGSWNSGTPLGASNVVPKIDMVGDALKQTKNLKSVKPNTTSKVSAEQNPLVKNIFERSLNEQNVAAYPGPIDPNKVGQNFDFSVVKAVDAESTDTAPEYTSPVGSAPKRLLTNEEMILLAKDKKLADSTYDKIDSTAEYVKNLNQYQDKEKTKAKEELISNYKNASKDEVIALQKELQQKGFNIGSSGADGIFGKNTKRALERQLDNESLDNSVVDKYYNKYKSDKSPETTEQVINIQNKLVKEGFLKSSQVDGKFGPVTKSAFEKSKQSKEPSGMFFTNIPTKLKEEQCAKGMCQILEQNDVLTEALGVKYRNAWDIKENMDRKKNSTEVYNIYDNPAFKNVKSGKQLVNTTRSVKSKSSTTADMYKPGDIIGIFWPGSSHHGDVLNSKTHNTHVGFVSGIKDGVPQITHNVHGEVRTEPYSNLYTGWIQRPKSNVNLQGVKYNFKEKPVENLDILLDAAEIKKERKFTSSEKNNIKNTIKRVHSDAINLTEALGSSADPKWIEAAAVGITGVETGIGTSVPRSKSDKSDLTQLGYSIKDVKNEDISLGVGKTKFSQLDDFSKAYFGIKSPKDLANDNKAIDVTTYNLIKHYDTFKDYAEQFPELDLTEDDIRSMSILAHNRGTKKLLTLGRRGEKGSKNYYKGSDEDIFFKEIERLRDISRMGAKQYDISSTDWKYVPGSSLLPGSVTGAASETYVSKVKRYMNDLYGVGSLGEQNKEMSFEESIWDDPYYKKVLSNKKEGGEFFELELDENQVTMYLNGGYILEEIK